MSYYNATDAELSTERQIYQVVAMSDINLIDTSSQTIYYSKKK